MRILKQFMLLIMTISVINFTSCSSDDDGGDGGNAADGTLVAKVEGSTFQSLSISSSATVSNNGDNLTIIATNSDGHAISLIVIGFDGDGTYPVGGGANIFNVASYTETDIDLSNPQNSTTEVWQAPYNDSMVGEIRISEESGTMIKGTFEFTAQNTGGDQSLVTITEGSFNLNKQNL